MEPKQIWNILGIEPTKEENIIKNAYRSRLITVNPEDDPEGFKKLRSAYEEALILAAKEEEEKEETPVSIWMDKIIDLYQCLPRRINSEAWKPLLSDDVCIDLETFQEAKEALLNYLMDHFRMPDTIWKLLDQEFSLCAEYEELYEKYPKNFIDFVVSQCQTESWFDYTLFKGAEDGDYDSFLQKYHEIRRKLDNEEDMDQLESDFKEIDQYGIYHPYLEIERVHYFISKHRLEDALNIITPIYEAYPDDTWILFTQAETEWKKGETEAAFEHYQILLEKEPEHYTAIVRTAEYYTQKEEYEKAKDFYIDAVRQNPNSRELSEAMEAVNIHLIKELRQQCCESKDDVALHLKLGWCLLQNHLYQEGIDLLKDMKPGPDDINEYHSLTGRLCFYAEHYEEAKDHINSWIVLLKKEEEEEAHMTPEEIQAKNEATDSAQMSERLGAAYGLLTSIYRKMGEQSLKEEQKSYFEKALESSAFAVSYDNSIEHLHQRASLLIIMEQYKNCVDVCDAILKIDSGYLPAYLLRQECYYNLRNARQVIDDFYNAYEIYPYYPDMYKFAAKVFFAYDQYDDVMDILNKAEDNDVHTLELSFLKLRTKRLMTRDHEEEKRIGEELAALEADYRKENRGHDEIAEVIYEEVLCLMDYKNYEEALHEIERAIRENPSVTAYTWTKADIFFETYKYKKAMELYKICEKDLPDSENLLEKIGRCYEKLEEPLKAVEYYKKVLELNPEHSRANSRIVDVYDDMLSDEEDIQYLDLALPYANRQLELVPEAYYFIERGLMFMTAGIWDKALADFDAAIKESPDNPYAYNNAGCVYKYTGRMEEALKMFQKAAECMKDGETMLPYGNLGDCYERLGEDEKALDAYMKNLELFPNSIGAHRDIADILRHMQRYDEAITYLKKILDMPSANRSYYLTAIGDSYEEKGDLDQAIYYLNLAAKENPQSGTALRSLGNLYRDHYRNYKKAEKCYKKALEIKDEYGEDCRLLEQIYYMMGKKKLAKQYFEKAMEAYCAQFGSIEKYIESFSYTPARLYIVGNMYFYIGDTENAKKYYDRMCTMDKCRKCTCQVCKEYLAGQARLLVTEKKYQEASELLEKAISQDPNLLEEKAILADIKKLMKEMN